MPPLDELPAIVGGRYRPLRLLGSGGMGAVYEAEHVHTGDRVALKVLLPQAFSSDLVARFKREARAAARIKSEHVVRVTDADVAPELGGAPFLVMELLEGEDLAARAGDRPQPPGDVLDWLRQLAAGLERAHAAGLVHRDLKPENLFLALAEGSSPVLKILDFGIAKMTADKDHSTQTGQVLGTPDYMSPEQARAEPVGVATDIWAIGMIAFRLLSGAEYWTANSVAHVLAQIIYEPIVAPSARGLDLGPAFDDWFSRSCAKDPAQRFSDVGAQLAALEEALAGRAEPAAALPRRVRATGDAASLASASSAADTEAAPTPTRRLSAIQLVLGFGAAVAIGLAFFVLYPRSSVPMPAPAVGAAVSAAEAARTPATVSAPPAPEVVVRPLGSASATEPEPTAGPAASASGPPRSHAPAVKGAPHPPAPSAPSSKPRSVDPLGDQK